MILPEKKHTTQIHFPHRSDDEMLLSLQRETFDYFLDMADPVTGLIIDKTKPASPSSIAVTGMAITAFIAAIERKFVTRNKAVERILKILRFFYNSPQSMEPDATGYKGFYYHFLDMRTGKRAWKSEISTIDTTFLIAGALSAASYFQNDTLEENEIRSLADQLYRRVDWVWALNGGTSISHGWKPECGFLEFCWDCEYSEAILLYMLALGSPTHPIPPQLYRQWTSTFEVRKCYGFEYIYAGPLFIHQFSHMWIDFRNINDDLNREVGIDFFENSKRATYIQRQYAIENPLKYNRYGANCWGFTASDGPGNEVITLDQNMRVFYDYIARGAPFGPDDGTVAPWAVVASLPFAPEIVVDTIRHAIERLNLKHHRLYGFDASFNPTYPQKTTNENGWVSQWRFGLNQGPIVIMIDNYRTGLIWEVMKRCPYLVHGLRLAGFRGGWIDKQK